MGSKVVKNGLKTTGIQNYLCNKCRKQFQSDYFYLGRQKDVRLMLNLSKVKERKKERMIFPKKVVSFFQKNGFIQRYNKKEFSLYLDL